MSKKFLKSGSKIFSSSNKIFFSKEPTTVGLVGWWRFDSTSGTVAIDSSGNGNNGTLLNMTNDDWVSGAFGNALDFDGIDDGVRVPDPAGGELDPSLITLSIWMKRTSVQPAWGRLFNKSSGLSSHDGYQMYLWDTTGRVGFYLRNGGSTTGDIDTGWTTPADTWTHVALTYDGSNVRVYGGGILRKTHSYTGGIGNSPIHLSFGYDSHWDDGVYRGLFDDVRIYNRPLDIGEIQEINIG